MKITIESTDLLTTFDGVPVRVWMGTTPRGTPVKVMVHRIVALAGDDCSELDAELQEQLPPGRVIPLRMIL